MTEVEIAKIEEFKNYIEQNPDKRIIIKDEAKKRKIKLNKLRAGFRKVYGLSPREYINFINHY